MNTEKDNNRRAYLYALLVLNRKMYEDAIKPIVEELAHMEAMRPPVCLVPTEVAQNIPFLRPQGSTT